MAVSPWDPDNPTENVVKRIGQVIQKNQSQEWPVQFDPTHIEAYVHWDDTEQPGVKCTLKGCRYIVSWMDLRCVYWHCVRGPDSTISLLVGLQMSSIDFGHSHSRLQNTWGSFGAPRVVICVEATWSFPKMYSRRAWEWCPGGGIGGPRISMTCFSVGKVHEVRTQLWRWKTANCNWYCVFRPTNELDPSRQENLGASFRCISNVTTNLEKIPDTEFEARRNPFAVAPGHHSQRGTE